MDAKFKINSKTLKTNLYDSLFSYIYKLENKENAENFIMTFKSIFYNLKTIYETDLEKLNNKEFCNFILSNYCIDLDIDDFINICNITNNKKDSYNPDFKTKMAGEEARISKPWGIGYGWKLEFCYISYKALLSDDINYNCNISYSKEEIEKMIQDKNIILIERVCSKLSKDDINLGTEEINEFKTYPLSNCIMSDSPYFKTFIDILRKEFSRQRILNDLKEYMFVLKKELDCLLKDMNFIYDQKEIISCASEILNDSYEYKKYQKLLNIFTM